VVFLSHHLFNWLSLHLGLSVYSLVSYLVCLFLVTIGSIYQVVIQSLHFYSFILKIQKKKKNHFALWHLIFLVLIIDLDTCMERLHLI
jgi:hypothetical protein